MNPTETDTGKHSRRRLGDDGSVTVIGAAVILGIIACCLLIVQVTVAVVAQHRAVAAADLVAVSAATVLLTAGEQQACSVAAQVASGNGSELVSCGTVDGTATNHGTPGVTGMAVKVRVGTREARAAAGPAER
ncbi:MAG TPA: flp pilus-assembly TadE/G-like family protein [Candidatus Corynebacterium avicola]|uniref:Flp pilus-assembly TadE/G-like family protein n=1 Tax=Candidatus Corynebacterium avicola TaxID=2838527 RepID=A0A9D1UMJ9_9CORY|nr:flp pilus-assembly TadE/G-like family protein [Candidatus Corynebacterium avicola]